MMIQLALPASGTKVAYLILGAGFNYADLEEILNPAAMTGQGR